MVSGGAAGAEAGRAGGEAAIKYNIIISQNIKNAGITILTFFVY